jgi:hypothetical protein
MALVVARATWTVTGGLSLQGPRTVIGRCSDKIVVGEQSRDVKNVEGRVEQLGAMPGTRWCRKRMP